MVESPGKPGWFNLATGASTFTYGYDIENRLRSAVAGSTTISLVYDPLGLLSEVTTSGGATTKFLYDGADLVVEYNAAGSVLRRYVHGGGIDEPLVWYEGSGTTDRRYFHADERGSIVAISNNSGAGTVSFNYSPDGESTNAASSRFGYTGQVWLAEVGLYYYKSRTYSSKLGHFLQPDAIGYAGGPNLYAYVGGDPVNWIDPYGLSRCAWVPDVIDQTCTTALHFYDTFMRDLYYLGLIEEGRDASAEGGDGTRTQGRQDSCTNSDPPSIGAVDHSESQTAEFLRQARNQAGLFEGFRNHSGSGRFDFVTNDYNDDTFIVNGFTYNAGQFGNFLAGYSGAYHGSFGGYLGVRWGGILYDLFERGINTDFDRGSLPYIQDGAAVGQLDRERQLPQTRCR